MAAHYVCPECGGTSNEPKTCSTEGCHHNGQQMEQCSCTDGSHGLVLNENI